MAFELTIIGSNSAIPSHGRHPTAQLLKTETEHYLIDCGDGTQVRMEHFHIRKFKISKIFISHLHGDHIYGLPGLLTTMNLLGRVKPLDIYGPPGIKGFIHDIFGYTGVELKYAVTFIEVECQEKTLLFENEDHAVFGFPLDHRVTTNGYLFVEKARPRHLDGQKAEEMNIPFEWRDRLKAGEDYVNAEGELIISSDDITTPSDPPTSYAFCSDTKYKPELASILKGVNCLYHEATFLDEMKEVAAERFHSTAKEAALCAQSAEAQMLILGHISSRYVNFQPLLEEAREVFPETHAAEEGHTFIIDGLRS